MTRFGIGERSSRARRARLFAVLALGSALATSGGCGRKEFLDPPCPEESTDDAFDISLSVPEDVHLGEVITFRFVVKRESAPVAGLAPEAGFRHDASEAEGAITLSAGAAGEYTGTKAFFTAGAYTIHFQFEDGGSTVARTFPMTVAAGH